MSDNDSPFLSFGEIWTMMHGREPTPEELEESRKHALMVLGAIAFSVTDSDHIWDELDKNP